MATVTATQSYSDNYYCNWRQLKINTAMYPSLHNITVLCMHREIERPRERKKRKREREGGREGGREEGSHLVASVGIEWRSAHGHRKICCAGSLTVQISADPHTE